MSSVHGFPRHTVINHNCKTSCGLIWGVFFTNWKLGSLRKHPFLLAPRRWGGRFAETSARNVPGGEERGETDVFAG